MFDPIDDLTRPEMGDFLRLSPWSEGLGQQAQTVALIDKPLGGLGAGCRKTLFW